MRIAIILFSLVFMLGCKSGVKNGVETRGNGINLNQVKQCEEAYNPIPLIIAGTPEYPYSQLPMGKYSFGALEFYLVGKDYENKLGSIHFKETEFSALQVICGTKLSENENSVVVSKFVNAFSLATNDRIKSSLTTYEFSLKGPQSLVITSTKTNLNESLNISETMDKWLIRFYKYSLNDYELRAVSTRSDSKFNFFISVKLKYLGN
ncbi:MAG: hypothetical protein SGI74_12380 [Oligoflexia bacterium]|nr:hypothetical protein [Oligoflexia bacterium]